MNLLVDIRVTTFMTGVSDPSHNIITGVKDTGHKFEIGVSDIDYKIITDVNKIGDKLHKDFKGQIQFKIELRFEVKCAWTVISIPIVTSPTGNGLVIWDIVM